MTSISISVPQAYTPFRPGELVPLVCDAGVMVDARGRIGSLWDGATELKVGFLQNNSEMRERN
jgi:hypothetical protein